MQHAERVSAIRPDEYQSVFAFWNTSQRLLHIGRALHIVTVDLYDDIATLQTSIVG